MKEFKGTKSEWKNQEPYNTFVYSSNGKLICQIKYDPFSEESLANAQLIAAAPELETRLQQSTDMLNALLVLFGDYMAVTTKFAVSQQIKENDNAINKALGL